MMMSEHQWWRRQAAGDEDRSAPAHRQSPASEREERLGPGRPLDPAERNLLGASQDNDLGAVRIHTGPEAAAMGRAYGAEGFATGSHIGLPSGRYQPGTPLGAALLAHELAHVEQHRRAGRPLAPSAALEGEANRRAVAVVAGRWPRLGRMSAGFARSLDRGRGALGGGLGLAACTRRTIAKPDFLGPESQRTFDTIQARLEAADLLENMLVAGPLIVLLTSSPPETAAGGGYPLEEQVRAVRAVDVIVRSRVRQDIELLLVQHGNELSPEEQRYWERILDVINRAGS